MSASFGNPHDLESPGSPYISGSVPFEAEFSTRYSLMITFYSLLAARYFSVRLLVTFLLATFYFLLIILFNFVRR